MAAPGAIGRRQEPDEPDLDAVLCALADPDCRTLLRTIGTGALTANECSDACDLPLSTTYRKLELLVDGDLLSEQIRIRRDGKHANQYRRDFEAVRVDIDEDGEFDVVLEGTS